MKTGTEARSAPGEGLAAEAAAANSWRIVQLAERGTGVLNARDQVAFTEFAAGRRIAKFFDGKVIRELGTLGGQNAEVGGINDKGEVTGFSQLASGVQHAFRWSRNGGMIDLGTLPGALESFGSDINNGGDVIGTAANPGDPLRAVLWRRGAGPLDLRVERGVQSFLELNDAGQVMGQGFDRNGAPQALSWTRAGGVVRLRGGGILDSDARDMNASGQITGLYTPADGSGFTGYLWTPGRSFVELGGANRPAPFGLNDRATVVGVQFLTQTAFVWTREGGTEEIGEPPFSNFSNAYSVNNRGQVVGQAATADAQVGFIWTRQDGMVDLNTRLRNAPPGFLLTFARYINERGAILGASTSGSLVLLVAGKGRDEPPVLGAIDAPIIARPGVTIAFSAAFTDVDAGDTHTATWSWGDGSEDAGTVVESGGAGTVTDSHVFAGPEATYPVRLTVTDSGGRSSTVRHDIIISPVAAYVAGAGGFVSPPGACARDPRLAGVAAFAFLVGYQRDGRAPQGAMLRFTFGGLDFESTRFDAQGLGDQRIIYRGRGRLNGEEGRQFALTLSPRAREEGADRIRLRIWHADPRSGAERVDYDSQGALNQGEGAAVLHGRLLLQEEGL